MPKWLRKSLVVLVTVLTFGLVTPPQSLLYDGVNEKPPKRDLVQAKSQDKASAEEQLRFEQTLPTEHDIINQLVRDAEYYSYAKFGSKIKPVIEDEFREIILPNIEKAISAVTVKYQNEDLNQLVISEAPTGGDSEKIFHIASTVSNQDVIRFHVRKDHPPQSGYWFNFHYHTFHDDFQEHHELGSIYWDKNTPPKWMS